YDLRIGKVVVYERGSRCVVWIAYPTPPVPVAIVDLVDFSSGGREYLLALEESNMIDTYFVEVRATANNKTIYLKHAVAVVIFVGAPARAAEATGLEVVARHRVGEGDIFGKVRRRV